MGLLAVTIAGVILAAGLSERMEAGPKQLLPFGTRTMIGHVVATAESTSLDPIVVVTGHRADDIEAAADPHRARFARNPAYEKGNMGSLLTGIAAAGDPDAVMALVVDQPEIDAEIIEAMAAAWEEWRPFAAVASYGGAIGHPWVLSRDAVAAAAGLSGSKALWGWLNEDHADEVLEVELSRPKPIDVNTIDDYRAALERVGLEKQTES